jgi:DNA-binding CsgD family transcriptional regulator
MSLPSLAALGVDPVAAEVYEIVLTRPAGVDVAGVVAVGQVDRGAATTALDRLRELGLVHRSATAPPDVGGAADSSADATRWAAVDPRVAVPALVSAQADALSAARASTAVLAELFDDTRRRDHPSATTRTVSGSADVGDWYSRLELRATRSFLAFDRPPYVVAGNESTERGSLGRGVRWRAVYTVDSFVAEGRWQGVRRLGGHGEEARITHDLPVKLAVADESIALVSIGHDPDRPEALVTESPALVAALGELFEQRWRTAVPVPVESVPGGDAPDWAAVAARVAAASGRPEAGRAPTPDERDLVALIAAGATDEVVAHRLGVSVRTVRRRLHDLLDELGASNRFHAGVEAARRGWI